ncbi:MAG: ATP-binding cassette domain-containing protein [Deltaproteobacteria bacterium]|nr:ATP-binding cassette domain-containing protein [Candidatus Zymogenaceae bacterium]
MSKSREELPSGKQLLKLYRRLLKFVWPYRYRFSFAVLMNLAFAGTTTAIAYLIDPLVDNLISFKDLGQLKVLTIAVVIVSVFRGLSNFLGTYNMRFVGLRVVKDIRDLLYSHIQRLSLKFFSGTHSGVLISRINNDVNLVTIAVTDAVEVGVKEFLTMIFLIGFCFYQDWLLSLLAFVVFPLMIFPIVRISRAVRKISTKGQVKMADLTTVMMEAFTGARIVKAFGMEDYESMRFEKENFRLFKNYLRIARVKALTGPLMEVIGTVGFALVLWYGGLLAIEQLNAVHFGKGAMFVSNTSYLGKYASIIAALVLIYPGVRALSRLNNAIQEAIAASIRIFNVLDTKPDITDKKGAVEMPPISKQVEFRNVSFRYEDEYVLKNINMTVQTGEVVAFVGMSGGGKTTLVNLVPRFYDVTEGAILIDGVDIRDVTLKSLRGQIGMVTQQTILFSDTIRNNIAYGRPETSDEEILRVSKAANAHKFIERLPDGYETMIGEQGMRLSGGERQRLSIARAILKDSPILILDEATSSLDTESELEVQKALENLMKGRTTFVIAHRLSTIQHANRIMVVVNGEIVEEGRHDELLKKGGEYRKLYEMQFRDQNNMKAPEDDQDGAKLEV